jgi:hypothetical protein
LEVDGRVPALLEHEALEKGEDQPDEGLGVEGRGEGADDMAAISDVRVDVTPDEVTAALRDW